MSSAPLPEGFFEWLDTAPCTPNGVIVQVGHETRVVPRAVALAEWRARNPEQGTRDRFPRLERRQNQVRLLSHLLEREERTNK
jgi:hypothetical protein